MEPQIINAIFERMLHAQELFDVRRDFYFEAEIGSDGKLRVQIWDNGDMNKCFFDRLIKIKEKPFDALCAISAAEGYGIGYTQALHDNHLEREDDFGPLEDITEVVRTARETMKKAMEE